MICSLCGKEINGAETKHCMECGAVYCKKCGGNLCKCCHSELSYYS